MKARAPAGGRVRPGLAGLGLALAARAASLLPLSLLLSGPPRSGRLVLRDGNARLARWRIDLGRQAAGRRPR